MVFYGFTKKSGWIALMVLQSVAGTSHGQAWMGDGDVQLFYLYDQVQGDEHPIP